MAAATEELANRSFTARELKRLGIEGIAVVIAATSLIVTIVSLILAGIAINNANRADIRSQEQTETINALRDEVDLLEVRVINAEKDE
jgi:hypothetical protein